MIPDENPLIDLRKRAEDTIQGMPVDLKGVSQENIQTLFYELQVHQIELELQNQALRETQESLEDAQRKYTDLYDFAPVGYFTLNQAGVIEEVNLAGATLVGIERSHLIQMPFSYLAYRDDQDTYFLYLRRLFKIASSESQEIRLVKPDGVPFDAQLTGVVVRNEQKHAAQCRMIVSDITEQKRAAHQALELAAHKEHVRTLSNFLNSASHEFRTPLTIITIELYLLKKSMDLPQENKHLDRTAKQVKYITKLVDALAAIARLDSDSDFEFETLHLNGLIEGVSLGIQLEAREKQITVVSEIDNALPPIQGNSSEIHRALLNILENAVRYMEPSGNILIRVAQHGESILIEVQDTGRGISEADIPYIFERFYRVDVNHSSRGIGLGLSIANQIIRRHGGTIEVESQLGQGSLFRIILPIHRPT
jgi:PAS domain S-box-containing protein